MLTYQSFVISFAVSSVISRSIQVLSQLIIKGSFRCNVIALNNLMKIASFAVCNRANNSASMLDVVPYLFTLQTIGPPNSFIIYPYKLFLLMELSINNASLAQINDCALPLPSLPSSYPLSRIPLSLPLPFVCSLSPLQQIALLLVLYRYWSLIQHRRSYFSQQGYRTDQQVYIGGRKRQTDRLVISREEFRFCYRSVLKTPFKIYLILVSYLLNIGFL